MAALTLPSRRQFLAALGAAGLGLAGQAPGLAAAGAPRTLSLFHTHTGEWLAVEYFTGADYREEALVAANHLLRDWRTDESYPIRPDLLDLLHALAAGTGTRQPFAVISGYRSPATNAMLRRESTGVAAASLHMRGMAVDIRLADVSLDRLRAAALRLRRGGVGLYRGSNFVHVDVGRVRSW